MSLSPLSPAPISPCRVCKHSGNSNSPMVQREETDRRATDSKRKKKKKTTEEREDEREKGLASVLGLCRRRASITVSPEVYRKTAGNLNPEISERFCWIVLRDDDDDESMTTSSLNCIVADTLFLTVSKITNDQIPNRLAIEPKSISQ